MDRYTLPHGAKGIEGEDFAVEFGADKLVFVPIHVAEDVATD